MTGPLLIRGARQLLSLHGPRAPRRGPALGDLGIIHDGALLIEDGRIVEVGTSRRVENLSRSRAAEEVDVTGKVVMPGFVDCHTHLVCGHPWLDDYEAHIAGENGWRGPQSSLNTVRSASTTRLEAHARHLLRSIVRHGTTTLEAKSGYGLDETGELKILRVHANLKDAPLGVASTFLCPPNGGNGEYLEWICGDLLPKIQYRGLAVFADFHADARGFDETRAREYFRAARKLGFRLKVHAAEHGPDPGARLAVEFQAVSADHLHYATPGDIELLAGSSTMAVLLPGHVLGVGGHPPAPARALIEAGAAVAVSTGFHPGSSPALSMHMIVSLACRQFGMSPAEAICAATCNAACAIGCSETAGSLEVGKTADLIVLDVDDYREVPYYFGVNLVRMAFKSGRLIYEQGDEDLSHLSPGFTM